MAEQAESIFIDVQFRANDVARELSEVTQQLAAMKKEQRELTREIEAGNDADGQKAKQLVAVRTEVENLTAQQKALTGQLQTTVEANAKLGDSFREMDAQLRQMENQYKSLTKAQRESTEGQALKKQIIVQKQALKDFDGELGNWQRNVGNYTNSILSAFGQMPQSVQRVVNPVKNVTMGFKALSTTPAIAIIGALVTIFQTLAEKFRGNEEGLQRLTSAFGIFKGVGVVIEKLLEGLSIAVGWLADKFVALADKLGLVNADMRESQAIIKEDIAIRQRQRELVYEEADAELEVAKLRNEAAKKDKYTDEERLALLQEAADKEKALAASRKEIAEREYNNIKRNNALTKSSSDDLDKEAQAYAKMVKSQTDYFNTTIRLESQMAAVRAEIAKKDEETRKKEMERRRAMRDEELRIFGQLQEAYLLYIDDEEQRELAVTELRFAREIDALKKKLETEKNLTDIARTNLNELIEVKQDELERQRAAIEKKWRDKRSKDELDSTKRLQQQLTDARLAMMDEGAAKEREQARVNAERQIAAIEAQRDAELNLTAEKEEAYKELILLKRQELADQLTKIDERYERERIEKERAANIELISARAEMIGSLAGVFNAMSDLLDAWSEENEEAANAAKAFAMMGIIAGQAQAIASGIAAQAEAVASAAGVPFPGNLVAIATSVASVASIIASIISGITQAKQLLSKSPKKFASGGVVGGSSYSGDKVPVMLNSGEVVLNPSQATRVLYQISNSPASAVNYDMMAAAMADAMRAIPAPVMVYKEFNDFQQNTATIKDLASL